MSVDTVLWKQELETHTEFFERLKARMPEELVLIKQMLSLSLSRF